MLDIHLRDSNPHLVSAWERAFADEPTVTVSCGDIFDTSADAIVSPANSFGHMDGGIDQVYTQRFGSQIETRLQAFLLERHFGELPIGQAVIIPTLHETIPFLVSSPTMRVPGSITKTVNVYLAFRAALIAVLTHNQISTLLIHSMLVPGMGTGVGEVPPDKAARQMRLAFDTIINGKGVKYRNVGQIWAEHHDLLL